MRAYHRGSLLFGLIILTLVAASCGNEEDSEFFFFATPNHIAVAGKYQIQLDPFASSCSGVVPLGSTAIMEVFQSGETIFLEVEEHSSFGVATIFVSSPAPSGPLFDDGSFNASSFGSYFDSFTGVSGNAEVFFSGIFGLNTVQGTNDLRLFDPFIGDICTLSHSFVGTRF